VKGTQEPDHEHRSINRTEPLTIARVAQLVLVVIVVAAAFTLAPGDPSSTVEGRLVAPVTEQDQSYADFADDIAQALGALQRQSDSPRGGGYLGTDRGDVFATAARDYERSIADVLVQAQLLPLDEVEAFARRDVTFLALQCHERVGVLVTSTVQVRQDVRDWWSRNSCPRTFDVSLDVSLDWPIFLALSDAA